MRDGSVLSPKIRWNFANNRTHGIIKLKLGNLQPCLIGQVEIYAYVAKTKNLQKLIFIIFYYIMLYCILVLKHVYLF